MYLGVLMAANNWQNGANSVGNKRINSNPGEPLGMPHDYEAEQAVIGSLLLKPSKLELVNQKLQPEDFFSENHRRIYQSILRLSLSEKSIDIINLSDDLQQQGLLEEIGGQPYLLNLQRKPPESVDILSYANIVSDKSQARKILNIINSIEQRLHSPGGESISSIRDELESILFQFHKRYD